MFFGLFDAYRISKETKKLLEETDRELEENRRRYEEEVKKLDEALENLEETGGYTDKRLIRHWQKAKKLAKEIEDYNKELDEHREDYEKGKKLLEEKVKERDEELEKLAEESKNMTTDEMLRQILYNTTKIRKDVENISLQLDHKILPAISYTISSVWGNASAIKQLISQSVMDLEDRIRYRSVDLSEKITSLWHKF